MLNNGRNRILNGIISAAHAGPIGLEVFMALTALRWAAYLLLPSDVLRNNTTATMALMVTFAPAWVWAVLFTLGGLGQAWAALGRHYRVRTAMAFSGIFIWLFITLADYTAGLTTATINLATFVFAQAVAYMLLIIAYEPEDTQ
jgi:hypothetical protein